LKQPEAAALKLNNNTIRENKQSQDKEENQAKSSEQLPFGMLSMSPGRNMKLKRQSSWR
jgi:hypothetical protein